MYPLGASSKRPEHTLNHAARTKQARSDITACRNSPDFS
jgi:hypothetical protein